MDLPRGTFKEIKKGVIIEELLEDLGRIRFSGACNISSDSVTGMLVFKSGKCILAQIEEKKGDPAYSDLLASKEDEVDAALSSLDDAQIQLSLEFNKNCRVLKAGQAPAARKSAQRSAPAPAAAPEPAPAARRTPSPAVERRPSPSPPAAAPAAPVAPAAPAAPVEAPARKPAEYPKAVPRAPAPPVMPAPQTAGSSRGTEQEPSLESEIASSFDKDIDTFDSMDLENVAEKIRNDCKTMIKQLHLEHLMEK
jgi:hypothetical protein